MIDPLKNSPKMLKALQKPYKGTGRAAHNALPINLLRKKAGVQPFYKDKV